MKVVTIDADKENGGGEEEQEEQEIEVRRREESGRAHYVIQKSTLVLLRIIFIPQQNGQKVSGVFFI